MNDELPASCRWVHISLVQSQSILITPLNLLNWRMHHCGQVLGGWYREEINIVQYRCMFRAVQTAKRNVWLRIINIKFYCPRWIQVNNFNWIQIFLALRCWVLVPSLRPIVTLHFKGSASTSFWERGGSARWSAICMLWCWNRRKSRQSTDSSASWAACSHCQWLIENSKLEVNQGRFILVH